MSEFIPFEQVATQREWEKHFSAPLSDVPTDLLLREYPNWARIDSKQFGPNFNAITKFIHEECTDVVMWREDDPFSTGEDSHAILHFKNGMDLVAFELRFGEITE